MKATPSKQESKKRKKDESEEPISEGPKKAKVHAQRKFAQGAAFNSPVITPIKDKVRPPASVSTSGPMLTTKCPNTEDFLTFLCFRRTSILPAKLDFFKDAVGSEPESTVPRDKSTSLWSNKSNIETGSKQNKKNDKNDENSKKPQSHTVQALRKKYQEQRLAKQKVTNVTKLAQKVKGKNMVRTRSSGVVEEVKKDTKKRLVDKETKSGPTGLRSGLKRIQPVAQKVAKKFGKRKLFRSGLRSDRSANKVSEKNQQETKPATINLKKIEKEKKKPKVEIKEAPTKSVRPKKIEGFSDFSSDDNEPLLVVKKPKTLGKKTGKTLIIAGKIGKKAFVKTRLQINELDSAKVSIRPTRKTKEAAAIYMEMITKKLVSPEKSGDDDVSSVDSFPELPNAKRNEQRETEIKAKALASKSVEPKHHIEEKSKESKKIITRKSDSATKTPETVPKIDVDKKPTKKKDSESKKESKEEYNTSESKRINKRSLKEESTKAKEKVEEIKSVVPPRPSTRSRHQEEVEATTKKLITKVNPEKNPKIVLSKTEEKQGSNKPGRKPKNKDSKLTLKAKSDKEDSTKVLEPAPEPKKTRKTAEKIVEEPEVKEYKKEGGTKRGRKWIEIKSKEKEADNKKKKIINKKPEKKKLKKEENKINEQENIAQKRPTRKCSTADKIWIDIDGFTSDEEDFMEITPATKTRSAAKREKNENEKSEEKKETGKIEKVVSSGSKSKADKNKEPEIGKESGKDEKKPEMKKAKAEIVKPEVAVQKSLQKENSENDEKVKGNASGLPKNENNKKSENKANEKREYSQTSIKDTKNKEEKKTKETGDPKPEVFVSKETPMKNTGEPESKKKYITSVQTSAKTDLKTNSGIDKSKKTPEESVKKTKKLPEEEKSPKKAKAGKKESESNKNKKSFKRREVSKEGGDEELEDTGRKRPVRQCSTREKRWIETDSDSFSFYATTDEEDNVPIVDFSGKNKIKPSPTETDAKETKNLGKKGEEKSVEPCSDNFSESDEEPLKKKSLLLEDTLIKTPEPKPESEVRAEVPETKGSGKTQREVPGLHPLKKTPSDSRIKGDDLGNSFNQKGDTVRVPNVNAFISSEPKVLIHDVHKLCNKPETSGVRQSVPTAIPEWRGSYNLEQRVNPPVTVPNRIEMILHSIKRDKIPEGNSSYPNNVNLAFGNVPYQPVPVPHHSQVSQFPCTYQIKTVTFPPPREPISTHGLDLLSEVALPDTSKEKISSRTERIEKWLKDSIAAEQKKRYPEYDEVADRSERLSTTILEKPKPQPGYFCNNPVPTPIKTDISSHAEFQKFGQVELLESQKLLKRNVFSAEPKPDTTKIEQQGTNTKKTLTSVQDLLKLQKERKESAKTQTDNSPHLKNCKCNNCIVKKGWFKNKPVPKADHQKLSPVDDSEESAKPFESLTKAFTKISGEGSNSKVSASVAPMIAFSPSSVKSSPDAIGPSSSKDPIEKKGIFQQRKLSFLERMKEREKKEAAAVKPSPNAFSPNNESSVYAFEPEPEQSAGVNTPFRSKTRESRTSSTSASRSDEDLSKVCEEEAATATVCSGTQVEKQSSESKMKTSQSASIAVQVNLDTETVSEVEASPELTDGKSIEISTQTEVPEEDSDSPMFYIPLQQARAGGSSASSDQQLIQGVALKLGTEGPMGPNQRVIMKAKLVTKAPDTPSIKAVVMPQPKRIFDQKNNNPPIGTVQPTTRKPPEALPEEETSSKPPNVPPVPLNKPSELLGVSDSLETLQKPSTSPVVDSEILTSKTNKSSTLCGKSANKSKEKVQNSNKDKNEISEEHSPCSSASLSKSKRTSKQKNSEPGINPSNNTSLPSIGTPSKLVEAPTFHPTEKEFQDPFEFFERIRPAAEKFGLCRIVPPSNFKPDCKVTDDMRFTAYNQYVHRMFHRWGPNVKEMMAIKKYLMTQSISLKQPPWIGGIEVDLPRLYQSVQNCGGLMKVMEKKKWHQVADMMKIPKAAQDRVTKLDDIYCKYLLPYDTLSHDERQKLFDEVEKDWLNREENPQGEEETEEENYIEECEECIVKGRNMALNQFYRIARNTMSMWFKNPEPPPREVENEFWKHVRERNHHVCVHSGSIDSSGWGYGFPIGKNNLFSKHPWNLKVLTNNCGSVLRSLGPVMGVTVPTLHVGMVFTAFCWYRDPHGLPWIEYLHTGAPKIWYGISDDNSSVFQEALAKLFPRYIKNKTIWLPSDTAMIPPDLLVEHGVSLCHTVQEPGQFILVFPRAFTSSICTGYLVSESVYFAQPSWLATAEQVFKDIQESCEPSMFSLEKLLFSIATDSRASVEVLKQVLPMVWHVRQKEIDGRKTLFNLGLKSSERLPTRPFGNKKKKGRWAQEDDGDYECEICRTNLYVSLVTNSHEEGVYCLPHAIELLTQKRHHLKYCKLMYTYTQEEMNELVEKLEQKIESKSQKKLPTKSSTTTK